MCLINNSVEINASCELSFLLRRFKDTVAFRIVA